MGNDVNFLSTTSIAFKKVLKEIFSSEIPLHERDTYLCKKLCSFYKAAQFSWHYPHVVPGMDLGIISLTGQLNFVSCMTYRIQQQIGSLKVNSKHDISMKWFTELEQQISVIKKIVKKKIRVLNFQIIVNTLATKEQTDQVFVSLALRL